MTSMMQVRIDTGRGPTFQELPDTPPPGAAGNLFLKKLENAVDKKAAPALSDSVPAPPTLAVDAEPSTSTLALQDQPSPTLAGDAEPSTTAQELRLRVMNARQQQVETRKAKVLFFQSVAVTTAQNLFPGGDDRSYVHLFVHACTPHAGSFCDCYHEEAFCECYHEEAFCDCYHEEAFCSFEDEAFCKSKEGEGIWHCSPCICTSGGDHRLSER